MPGSRSHMEPASTVPSSVVSSNVPPTHSSDSDQSSDDFDLDEPQSLHQVPFLDEKPRGWRRNQTHVGPHGNQYQDSYSDEKRGLEDPTLNGNRYGLQDDTEFQWPLRSAHAYRDRRYSRPLLEYARNDWRNDLYADSSPSSPTFSDEDPPSLLQILSAPRFRRYAIEFLSIMSLLSFAWAIWIGWVQPARWENKALNESLNLTMSEGHMLFGHNMTPAFLGMVRLKTLDKKLVPQKGDRRRLVLVGDVHGCHDELVHLLSKLSFNQRDDHIVFTGDLVSKGPSSAAVVDLAISLGASCVRGNHEDRILLAHRDTVSHPLTLPGLGDKATTPLTSSNPPVKFSQPQKNRDKSQLASDGTDDRVLAQTLTKAQIDYLSSCPLILHLGHLPHLGPTHVVHAGLVPGLALEMQDPVAVMNMRTIDLRNHVPSSRAEGTPWPKLWNRYQTVLSAEERATVVYGHDSRRGLRVAKWSVGLDSGCVKGGKLTAVVVDGGKEVRTVSVRCRNHVGKKWWNKG